MKPLLLLLLLSATPKPMLLMPGTYFGTEIQAADGDSYLALCEGGNELRPVRLRVQQVGDSPPREGVPTGTDVSAPCDPIVLLRDVQGVREGPVEQAQVTLPPLGTASSATGPLPRGSSCVAGRGASSARLWVRRAFA
ncbi:hypothetical protein ACN28S_41460 [Cystobacter fuscus]